MRTIIHVNQHNIRANDKGMIDAAEKPVITVKDYKQNRKGNGAVILDNHGNEVARVVYRPYHPLKCGAKVWIETQLEVEVEQ